MAFPNFASLDRDHNPENQSLIQPEIVELQPYNTVATSGGFLSIVQAVFTLPCHLEEQALGNCGTVRGCVRWLVIPKEVESPQSGGGRDGDY